jgi:hypothetical protein
MRFQSFIEVIMHGDGFAARAVVLSGVFGGFLGLGGCASINATKHTYTKAMSSPTVRVNGAEIAVQLKPAGTSGGAFAFSAMVYSAAVATLDGPFDWRIEGTGVPGRHESLVVHRIRTRTEVTKRDEWYPGEHLGKCVDFVRKWGGVGAVKAVFDVPGLLQVKPREDGALVILVDLTVRAGGRAVRETVRFRLEPSKERQDEFIFVPAEIIRGMGESPEDWEEW